MASYTVARSRRAEPNVLRLNPDNHNRNGLLALPLTMDSFDPSLNFDQGTGRLLDENHGLPSLPFTPSYDIDNFSTTFEDPFAYQHTTFEHILEDTSNTEAPASADLDDKLLGFGLPNIQHPLLNDAGQTWPSMSAELYGMFFLAESVYNSGEGGGRPTELTCYRRNLFQISGSLTISRTLGWVDTDGSSFQNPSNRIVDLSLAVSATESIEGKSTEIISVPWKSTSNATSSEDKSGTAPLPQNVNLMSDQDADPDFLTMPISWKRLQFKHATANNGRRKGLQQHYVIHISLMATINTGEVVKLADIQSGPIIVRGRSPRNFDSRKDLPLTGDRAVSARADTRPRSQSTNAPAEGPQTPIKLNSEMAQDYHRYYVLNAVQTPLDLPEWANFQESGERLPKRPSLANSNSNSNSSGTFVVPPLPHSWSSSNSTSNPSTNNNNNNNNVAHLNTPIGLSLTDEDFGRAGAGRRSAKTESPSPTMARKPTIGSPLDSGELLYEYFPLSVDDWMPPVDAIYRPHVVHHTIVPEDLKAQVVRNKSKRYFSADD